MEIIQQPFCRGKQQLSIVHTDLKEAEALVRDMAEAEADRHPKDFAGTTACVYCKLPYVPPCEPFKELRRLILRIRENTGLRAHFKGVVAIEASEWIGHEQEEYFTVMLKYLFDHRDLWVNALILNQCTPLQLQRFSAACARYITPRLYDVSLFGNPELLISHIQEEVAARGHRIKKAAAQQLATMLCHEALKEHRSLSLISRIVEDAIMAAGHGVISADTVQEILDNPFATVTMILGRRLPEVRRIER